MSKCIYSQEQYDKINNELNLANQQIAEIKAKLKELEEALDTKESINQLYKNTLSLKDSDFSDLVRENGQLKQQLRELPKKIVDEIKLNACKKQVCHDMYSTDCYSYSISEQFLNNLLKKYEELYK